MNRLHPSRLRDDDNLFQSGYQPYVPGRDLWLAYVPKWVDTVLLVGLGLAVGAELIYRVLREYF